VNFSGEFLIFIGFFLLEMKNKMVKGTKYGNLPASSRSIFVEYVSFLISKLCPCFI